VLGFIALTLGYGLLGLMCVGLIAMPLQIVACAVTVRRLWPGSLRFRFTLADTPGFLRASLPFGLSALALTVSFNADTFLLSLRYPSEVVGWYGAAYRLVPTLVSILGGFLTVITPSLASRFYSEPEIVKAWVSSSIRGLALFSLPIAVGACLLAPQIVALLYGPAYGPSALALALLAWDVPLRLFNAFAGNVAAAVNLERFSGGIFLTGSLTGLLLYLITIPLFGIVGAATVTVIADGLTATIFFVFFCRKLGTARVLGALARTTLAAALLGVIVWVVAEWAGLLPTIAIGIVSYGFAALALGLIDRALLARLGRLVRRC
jgi:O-antigen/teichoic acid export membrane protein